MNNINLNTVCFGEVLWDNLPEGKKPGGAPMNVAYHLKTLGIASHIISRVGDDANGRELLQAIQQLGLSIDYCQVDTAHQTSTVEVDIGADGHIAYDIVNDVAWDYIEPDAAVEPLVRQAGALIFGSLSGRNQRSRETLDWLTYMATYKVFDINLRPPHFSQQRLVELLKKTDLLKLNREELQIVTGWYGADKYTEAEKVKVIQDKFAINELVVTKGGSGVTFYQGDQCYNYPAYQITVKDAVGSGDSFLAAFLSGKLKGADIMETLDFASAVAAFVTEQPGACPPYNISAIQQFKNHHQLNKR